MLEACFRPFKRIIRACGYNYMFFTFGSPSTHTLISHFDVDLQIITLLKGERKVDKAIHKKEFFKPLTKENLENAINVLSSLLEGYK